MNCVDPDSTVFKFCLQVKSNDNDPPTLIEVVFFEHVPKMKHEPWDIAADSRKRDDPRGTPNIPLAKTIAAFVHDRYADYTFVGVL